MHDKDHYDGLISEFPTAKLSDEDIWYLHKENCRVCKMADALAADEEEFGPVPEEVRDEISEAWERLAERSKLPCICYPNMCPQGCEPACPRCS
jgi:hypothetical protein